MNTIPPPKSVNDLWNRLEEMERELRFDGRSYPKGMCSFPFKLSGQGFFPGGDGLWRDLDQLGAVKDGLLPRSGVVFLGNDFGTLQTCNKWKRRGYEIVPTWKHLKYRIQSAKIPPDKTFFTNAILGLREVGSALDKKCWQTMASFAQFCGQFLSYELEVLAPKLVVVMGPDARVAFDTLTLNDRPFRVFYTTHPYADFGFSQNRLTEEIEALAVAWEKD
ncbi:MAG TPA: hypothetical protein VGG85_03670 [Terracidiphilus sp.]|jgi:hypothetical protein